MSIVLDIIYKKNKPSLLKYEIILTQKSRDACGLAHLLRTHSESVNNKNRNNNSLHQ